LERRRLQEVSLRLEGEEEEDGDERPLEGRKEGRKRVWVSEKRRPGG